MVTQNPFNRAKDIIVQYLGDSLHQESPIILIVTDDIKEMLNNEFKEELENLKMHKEEHLFANSKALKIKVFKICTEREYQELSPIIIDNAFIIDLNDLKQKKVYSLNEIAYYDYDDIVAIMENEGESDFIFMADKICQKHSNFLDVDCVIEEMQDRASELGEWGESYLTDLSKEQKEELHSTVLDWFNKNISQPSFFLVENIQKITLEDFKKNK